RRPPVLGVPRVQVQDRRAGLGSLERVLGDLLGRERQVLRHRRRVDRAGDRAGDDHFVGHDASSYDGCVGRLTSEPTYRLLGSAGVLTRRYGAPSIAAMRYKVTASRYKPQRSTP